LAASRQWGHAYHAAQALLGLGAVAAIRSDQDAGATLLEASIAAAQEIPDARLAEIMTGVGLCNLVEIDRMRGHHELAVSRQTEALRRFRTTGFKTGTILALVGLGYLASDANDYAQALEWYREALEVGREHPDSRVVFEAIRALAIVAVTIGQAASGARLLGATGALHDRNGLSYSLAGNPTEQDEAVAMARAALGEPEFFEAWSAGRSLQPRQAVDEALNLFDSPNGSSSASLVTEIAEWERLNAATKTPRAGESSVLSPREREVVELLVAGKSNPAIAEALFISTRTVENHVAHIFVKLGVSSRTAVVASAISSGLLTTDESPSR
jgi:DNA-binding CsgD family transcriptional regulator/tetratricopeptide (TPR) repeat protein